MCSKLRFRNSRYPVGNVKHNVKSPSPDRMDRKRSGKERLRIGIRLQTTLLAVIFIIACAAQPPPPPTQPPNYPKPYRVGNKWYQPIPHSRGFVQKGRASWYGKKFHGRKTSSGEIYNMYAMTAAHKTLPLGTYVRVTNLTNHREIVVRINDRGPFVRGRIIDLSYTAAKKMGIVGPGTAPVKLVALGTRRPQAASSSGTPAYVPVDFYSGNFTIQVGAFHDRLNAERLRAKLARSYSNAHIMTYRHGAETFYRVRVGKASTLDQAVEFENRMIQNGFVDAFIIAE